MTERGHGMASIAAPAVIVTARGIIIGRHRNGAAGIVKSAVPIDFDVAGVAIHKVHKIAGVVEKREIWRPRRFRLVPGIGP